MKKGVPADLSNTMLKTKTGEKYIMCSVIIRSIHHYFWRDSPQWSKASSFLMFLDHAQRRTTVGRTPLDE